MTAQDAALLASLTGYVGNRWPRRMASDVAPDLHRIATEQGVEIERLREALEDAEYDLAQWVECAPELIRAGFNMGGTAVVLAKVSAALQVQP